MDFGSKSCKKGGQKGGQRAVN